MVNLFYDKKLRLEAKSYQLFPLLQKLEEKNSDLSNYFKLVDNIEDCDLGIVPMNIQFLMLRNMKRDVMDFIDRCRKMGKEVLIFSGGDYGVSLDDEGIYSIRLGGFHSKLNSNTFMMPPFINDPRIILNKKLDVINKTEKPTIGFVGHANGSVLKFIKEYILFLKGIINRIIGKDVTDHQFFYPSSINRFKYLKNLSGNPGLKCDFIYRDQYRAGINKDDDDHSTTREFYQNIHQNLYTFCLRGTGNFSVRFYETLAMGRIPVLIDTDCRLPFHEQINWKNHVIIVGENEAHSLDQAIIEFHNNTSQQELTSMQIENRLIWENYLRKTSYFVKIGEFLEKLKNAV